MAGVYVLIGVFHWILRRRFLTISFQPETALAKGWSIRWWDFLFYLSFGIVITFSVPVAGVLLVFSFLVVPAAIAFQFTRRYGPLAIASWLAGAVASACGLLVSFRYDLPTGPIVVCMFGLLLLVSVAVRRLTGVSVPAVEPRVEEAA
jgi:zinc/manganese transport system permease protein